MAGKVDMSIAKDADAFDFEDGGPGGADDFPDVIDDRKSPDPADVTRDRDGVRVRTSQGKDLATRSYRGEVDEDEYDIQDPSEVEDDEDASAAGDDDDGGDSNDTNNSRNGKDAGAGRDGWFTPDLMRDASLVGITPSEARLFGSEEAVRTAIAVANRRGGRGEPAKGDDKKPADDDFDFKIEDEDTDPTVKKMAEHYNKKLRAMRDELSSTKGALTDMGQERLVNRFDSIVNTVKDRDLKNLLGEGESIDMPDGDQAELRARVFDRWQDDLDRAYRNQTRITAKLERELFEQAARAVLHKELKQAQRQRVSRQETSRERFRAARPSSSSTNDSRTPYQKAISRVKGYLRRESGY